MITTLTIVGPQDVEIRVEAGAVSMRFHSDLEVSPHESFELRIVSEANTLVNGLITKLVDAKRSLHNEAIARAGANAFLEKGEA